MRVLKGGTYVRRAQRWQMSPAIHPDLILLPSGRVSHIAPALRNGLLSVLGD
jgi:hypothetical protein